MLKECWHRADRTKLCRGACGERLPLTEFSSYPYVINQGKNSTRYESRCRPCNAKRRMERYRSDPENERMISNSWKGRNKDHLRDYNKVKQKDPAYRALKTKSQRLRKARTRSGQGDNEAIRTIYAQAMEIEKIIAPCPIFAMPELGYKMHVDHIVALANGGLHHEDNLQILPAGINMRKGTK